MGSEGFALGRTEGLEHGNVRCTAATTTLHDHLLSVDFVDGRCLDFLKLDQDLIADKLLLVLDLITVGALNCELDLDLAIALDDAHEKKIDVHPSPLFRFPPLLKRGGHSPVVSNVHLAMNGGNLS